MINFRGIGLYRRKNLKWWNISITFVFKNRMYDIVNTALRGWQVYKYHKEAKDHYWQQEYGAGRIWIGIFKIN